MKHFEIQSFVGALPLRFGMTPNEVHGILGSPRTVRTNRLGEKDEDYLQASAGYDKESTMLKELGFVQPAVVLFRDIDLFRDADAIPRLVEADGAPLEGLGFIVFPTLGIALTDFFSEQESDRAITVFARGRWTDLKGFKPFSIAGSSR